MIAALNKHYRSVSNDEYWNDWDIPTTNNAIEIAQFPEPVIKWIWEKKCSCGIYVPDIPKPSRKQTEIKVVK